jgi:hypothetical protein
MASEPLSLRAYAAHRKAHKLPGGSLQAVQRAVDAERVYRAVVVVNGRRMIGNVVLADREWAENTDHTKATVDMLERAAAAKARIRASSGVVYDGPAKIERLDVGVVDEGLLCVMDLDDPNEESGLTLDRAGALELARRLVDVANSPAMLKPFVP